MKKLIMTILLGMHMQLGAMVIKFEGIQVPLLDLVLESKQDTRHAFSVTSLFKYEDETFIFKGDMSVLTTQDEQDVRIDNVAYCAFYGKFMTRLGDKKLGALIFGGAGVENVVEKFQAYQRQKKAVNSRGFME